MPILLIIGIVLFVLWLFGVITSRTLNGLAHIALVIAVILIVVWLLQSILKVF